MRIEHGAVTAFTEFPGCNPFCFRAFRRCYLARKQIGAALSQAADTDSQIFGEFLLFTFDIHHEPVQRMSERHFDTVSGDRSRTYGFVRPQQVRSLVAFRLLVVRYRVHVHAVRYFVLYVVACRIIGVKRHQSVAQFAFLETRCPCAVFPCQDDVPVRSGILFNVKPYSVAVGERPAAVLGDICAGGHIPVLREQKFHKPIFRHTHLFFFITRRKTEKTENYNIYPVCISFSLLHHINTN